MLFSLLPLNRSLPFAFLSPLLLRVSLSLWFDILLFFLHVLSFPFSIPHLPFPPLSFFCFFPPSTISFLSPPPSSFLLLPLPFPSTISSPLVPPSTPSSSFPSPPPPSLCLLSHGIHGIRNVCGEGRDACQALHHTAEITGGWMGGSLVEEWMEYKARGGLVWS